MTAATSGNERFSSEDVYAYARGYHVGREDGTVDDDMLSECPDRYRFMFRRGYDAGVADYAEEEMAKWKRSRKI